MLDAAEALIPAEVLKALQGASPKDRTDQGPPIPPSGVGGRAADGGSTAEGVALMSVRLCVMDVAALFFAGGGGGRNTSGRGNFPPCPMTPLADRLGPDGTCHSHLGPLGKEGGGKVGSLTSDILPFCTAAGPPAPDPEGMEQVAVVNRRGGVWC